MSDTPRELEAMVVKEAMARVRIAELERELAEVKALLQNACAELPVSYYPDSTPDKLASNIAGFIKDYTENYLDLEKCQEQLTAHKAALEKCERVMKDILENDWIGIPAVQSSVTEALSEIAKLKGNQ